MKKCLRIQSVKVLERALSIDVGRLQEISRNIENYYRVYTKNKPDGSKRIIAEPVPELKNIQRNIDRRLLRQIPFTDLAYGAVPGRRHIDGARLHTNQECVATLDIKNCFPSIRNRTVYRFLVEYGCCPDAASLLTRLVTRSGSLPQGSPASPTLANLILAKIDRALLASASDGTRLSRFIDDVAMSGSRDAVLHLLQEAIAELARLGFGIQRRKLKVQPRRGRQIVTNLVVNHRVSLPRSSKDKRISRKALRDSVRRVLRYGATEREVSRLSGQIQYLATLHPRQAERFLRMLSLTSEQTQRNSGTLALVHDTRIAPTLLDPGSRPPLVVVGS